MSFIIILLILASLAGAVFLNRNAKAWGLSTSPPAIGLLVLALVLILVRMAGCRGPDPEEQANRHISSYQTVQAVMAGRNVAQRHPGKRVTLLVPPKSFGMYRSTDMLDAMVNGLVGEMEKGGLRVQVKPIPLPPHVDHLNVSAVSRDSMDPPGGEDEGSLELTRVFLEYYTTRRFGRIILDQKDADVVVCLFDLPMQIDGRELPTKGSGPALVMMYDNVSDLPVALTSTLLDAVVLQKNPGKPWDYRQSIPGSPEAAFEKWFHWVTPENRSGISDPRL